MSLPCLPCRAAATAAVWTVETKALKARSPRGQRSPPSVAVRGGGARSMSTTDLVAFGCGRLRPRGGDRRCGTARPLKAAEMRLKTSGSAAGGSGAGGKGCPLGWGAEEAESCSVESALGGMASGWALSGAGLKLLPAVGGGENRSAPPPPGCADPILEALPWSVGG